MSFRPVGRGDCFTGRRVLVPAWQSGYNKRLRAAVPLIKRLIRVLAADTDLWTAPVWVVDSVRHEAPWMRVELRNLHRRVGAAARLKLGQADPGGAGKGGKQP